MNKAIEYALWKISKAKADQNATLDLSASWGSSTNDRLDEIPIEVFDLKQLTELYLTNNNLTSLPDSIANLTNLRRLNLRGNQLTSLPYSISNLQCLSELDLSCNRFTSLPDAISSLKNLAALYLSYNGLMAIPDTTAGLLKLTTINLSHNRLNNFPEVITDLKNLTMLNLSGNKLTSLPTAIANLKKLTTLNLAYNQLTALPDNINSLRYLVALNLSNNQLTSIPKAVTRLQQLKWLYLSGNQLTALPGTITNLKRITRLELESNRIASPPPEVVRNGIPAIREYFRQIEAEGTDFLYEAKLLIVGEGGAGKTTFANKIINEEYELDADEKSTEGIAISYWDFPMDDSNDFRVNIWDFGGQEIYHATHQFFLTKRSLYVLIADCRKDDTDFDYWLSIVSLLSDNSPILVVLNEKQNRTRPINENAFRAHFPNLKEVLRTNLADNRGLGNVITEVKHRIRQLPIVGAPLPKTWVRVREALDSDPRNHIGLDEYLYICQRTGFKNNADKLQLSGYLHDIGVCLHFQDDPILRKHVILKPKWSTDAVYKVLDNKDVISNQGEFDRNDLATIWDEPEYVDMHGELLQLMINFKLCYQIPNLDSYIAPQLLNVQQPIYDWDENVNLYLRYSYEFMPKGIVTQLIVAMHYNGLGKLDR